MITLNQTHSKKFHCTYLLHYYPFDTQVRQRDLSQEYNEQQQQKYNFVVKYSGLPCSSAVRAIF